MRKFKGTKINITSTTDHAFPQCSIDRPNGASPDGRMVLVNHFLDTNLSGILIPNRDAANVTNSASSVMAQANICAGLYGRNPNFILVSNVPPLGSRPRSFKTLKQKTSQLDWMSVGDGMPVQAMMNGLQYIPSVTYTTAGTGTRSPNATATTGGGSVVAETTAVSKLLCVVGRR